MALARGRSGERRLTINEKRILCAQAQGNKKGQHHPAAQDAEQVHHAIPEGDGRGRLGIGISLSNARTGNCPVESIDG